MYKYSKMNSKLTFSIHHLCSFSNFSKCKKIKSSQFKIFELNSLSSSRILSNIII